MTTLRKMIAASVFCSTAACYSVRPLAAPHTFIEQQRPAQVWVADTAGEVIRLEGPTVRGDSVVGVLQGTSEPIAIELTTDHAVFARQKSPAKTAELVGGLGVVTGLFVYGYIKSQNGPEDCTSAGANPTGRPYC